MAFLGLLSPQQTNYFPPNILISCISCLKHFRNVTLSVCKCKLVADADAWDHPKAVRKQHSGGTRFRVERPFVATASNNRAFGVFEEIGRLPSTLRYLFDPLFQNTALVNSD